MTSLLDEVDDLLDRLAETDLSSGDEVVRLHSQLARLDAITTKAVASFDAGREWAGDGAKSATAWITSRCRVPGAVARRRVALARGCRVLSLTDKVWLRGDITSDHVSLLTRAHNERTADALVRDEAFLVEQASRLSFRHFARTLAYWLQHADPDGSDADGDRRVDGRRFDLSQSYAGTWFGDLRLDAIRGTIVSDAVRAIERELFEQDWAAKSTRTPTQRRADALVELAIRAMTAPRDGRRPAPLFTVLVGYETLAGRICELANRTVVAPGALLPWLDQAYIERVVFDGPSRVIDVGVHRRLFVGATRRAVEVRDLECFSNVCEEPAEDCQIDHIEPWTAGGLTIQDNGRPACGFHNRGRHRRPGAG